LYFGPRGFAGTHRGFGRPVYRLVEVEPTAIVISDYAECSILLDEALPDGRSAGEGARLPFSAGYGIVATGDGRAVARADARAEEETQQECPRYLLIH
jgi:hypothetical protein